MLRDNKKFAREGDWTSHPDVGPPRPPSLRRSGLLRLARETRRRIHVLHVSTADELPLLAAAKRHCDGGNDAAASDACGA